MKDKTKGKNLIIGISQTQKWLRFIQRVPLIEKTELLNDILLKNEE